MKSSDPDRSILQRHRRNILFALAAAPIILLDCTAGVLLLPADSNAFRESNAFYHHGLMPNRSVVARWGSGDEYPVFTNSLGLLDSRIRDVPLKSDEHRILFLGDSVLAGEGLGQLKERFPILFGEKLGHQVDVQILAAADTTGALRSVLVNMAGYARLSGHLEEAEIDQFVADIDESLEAGAYFAVLPQFLVHGRA